jgi:hypothetical protein
MHSRFFRRGNTRRGPSATAPPIRPGSTAGFGQPPPYFHNIIGILTETIGNPTPIEIPSCRTASSPTATSLPHRATAVAVPAIHRLLHDSQRERSWTWRRWYRETFLYNIYVMGRNAITRGEHRQLDPRPRGRSTGSRSRRPRIVRRRPPARAAASGAGRTPGALLRHAPPTRRPGSAGLRSSPPIRSIFSRPPSSSTP